MANEKNLKPFPKGVSGNPLGAKLRNPELMAIRRLTSVEVAEIGTLMLEGNIEKLQALATDKEASVLKVWIAALIVKSMNKGDSTTFNAIMDRIVGKPKERIDINSTELQVRLISDSDLETRIKTLTSQLGVASPIEDV
jgi:hypothetical protein